MNGDGDGDRDRVADVPTLQIARTFKIYTNIQTSHTHQKNKKAKQSPFENQKQFEIRQNFSKNPNQTQTHTRNIIFG